MRVNPSRSAGVLASGVALSIMVAAAFPVAAQDTRAAKSKNPFSFELGTGYRYNSRLAVPDLDLASDRGDSAFLLNGGLKLDLDITDRTSFGAGLSFSQVDYQDLSAFDTRIAIGSLELKHDFGGVDTGISYHHAQSDLGGRDYLTYSRLSPHASVDVNERLMLRGAYVHTRKDFDFVPDRDSTTRGLGLDAYFFLNGPRTYVSLGYLHEQNDARAAQFDYSADSYALRFAHNFQLAGLRSRFRVGYRHEQRDYDAVTPSIGMVRDDSRNSFDAQLRVRFTDRLFAELEHEVKDHASNLPAADYSQNVTSLSLGLEF